MPIGKFVTSGYLLALVLAAAPALAQDDAAKDF
ncbi:MAG: hypothetical protein QOE02_5282, partial [Rhodospirillaceae bacterium]|nr:hypothetical protein [Rhodospirillaceae bacterium]